MDKALPELALWLDPRALQLVLVLALSFLLGLEREGRKATAGHYVFGGVRTFPLIGLLGYAVALLAQGSWIAVMLGLLAVAALLVVSYAHKVATQGEAGVTTEMTGLYTFVVGALVAMSAYWIASTLVVVALLLLELKAFLEGLAERIPPREVLTLTQFLLVSAVVLPLLPNRPFGPFAINPFRLWLVVVAVSGLSYLSYLLQRQLGERASLPLSALLGGLYSSTVTTLVLARRSREAGSWASYAAASLLASSVMYLRVLLLVAVFAPGLAQRLRFALLGLFFLGAASAALWLVGSLRSAGEAALPARVNPLQLSTALAFALVFLLLTVGSQVVASWWGAAGAYLFAFLAGFADVDPYVMSLAQQVSVGAMLELAGKATLVALAGNQLAKGLYAWFLGSKPMGRATLAVLSLMAGLTLLWAFWV
jgi:uncharacterized membrane protein (DUF4010 family)